MFSMNTILNLFLHCIFMFYVLKDDRTVALKKLVERLEDRIKNGRNSSKEGLFVMLTNLDFWFSFQKSFTLFGFPTFRL